MSMVAIIVVAVAAVVVVLLIGEVFLEYPPPRLPEGALLSRKEQAVVAACADALFPPGGPIPSSGCEAGLVAYMDRYLAGLPPLARLLGRLLFHSVEHGPWFFGPRPARFTRLSPEERIEALRAMSESPLYFRRVSFLSMRAMMTMGYLSCPAVAQSMGMVANLSPFDHPDARPRAGVDAPTAAAPEVIA
jgi:hypothetical protein